jgi:hypothetical protein
MAINIPILTEFSDSGIKAAKAAFGNFKTAVADAEGGMNKFKAGSTAALDAVKANAATFAIAAGAAIGTFAVKAIQEFQNLALAAGKFSDATGLAVEDASRYIEVAGDLSIPVDAVEGAIGRLNKTIGADPDKVRNLGIDLVYLKDGSLDVNETFLNTIERLKGIKDPAEKARVAAQLLGKGWQGMAELIEMGADDLNASLDGVSNSRIINETELKRARDFRDSMDNLNDKIGDVTLAIGQFLLPVIENLVDKALAITDVDMPGWFTAVTKSGELFGKGLLMGPVDAMKSTYGATEDLNDELSTYARRQTDARSDMTALTEAIEDQQDGIAELTAEWQTLLGTLDDREAFDNLDKSLTDLHDAAVAAWGGSAQEVRDYNAAQKDAIEQIADLAIAMDLTFGEQNKLKIFVDSGDLQGARDLLDQIARIAKIGPLYDSGIAQIVKPQALGGPVMGGTTYLVGEQGPELFTPSSAGNITPNHALGGGGTINITVTSADPNEVVRALQTYVRQSGPVPVNTRTM